MSSARPGRARPPAAGGPLGAAAGAGPTSSPSRSLGFSWPVLVALAALAAPRVVLHDLGVIREGSLVNGLLVFVPLACWVAAVLWKRPPRAFLTVVVIGALYGLFLALGHQLLWGSAFGGAPPDLGSRISPGASEAIVRTSAVVSSLVTGTLVGVVTGAVAVLLVRVVPGHRRVKNGPPTADRTGDAAL